MKIRIIGSIVAAALFSASASGQNTYSGKVSSVQVVDGSMHLRVILSSPMSNCDLNFAFVDASQSIYDAAVASVTTAYATGNTLTIQVNREASGYCRIFFMTY